ncbi:MAG: 50S ribosomal protein L11 methyltransferase [Armatimonadetes bacterium]|nr:50S ribosomal protein L11 methyltransferase [Armatimonadota bacterium]
MPRSGEWLRVTIDVTPQAVEAAGEILRVAGCAGWESPSPGTVAGYLPADDRGGERVAAIRKRVARLREHGLDPGPARVTAERIAERPWAEAWKSYFRPMWVGCVVICPTWESVVPGPGEALVRLDPGMAFGSGAHATTRLCLRALQEAMDARPRTRVLDVGTGSGILAISAARLGAARVLAVDTDPDVIPIAAANAALNDVSGAVEVREGDIAAAGGETFDVIVANIAPGPVIGIAPQSRALLAPGGAFIGGGIPASRAEEVRQGLTASGLTVERTLQEQDWVAVVAR